MLDTLLKNFFYAVGITTVLVIFGSGSEPLDFARFIGMYKEIGFWRWAVPIFMALLASDFYSGRKKKEPEQ